MEASFSTLITSIASSALTSMEALSHPMEGETSSSDKRLHKSNKLMASFNINLLLLLKEKTQGNLSSTEGELLEQLIKDLQFKFAQLKEDKEG